MKKGFSIPKNTYISNRDSTAGRNNDNPELDRLDREYAQEPEREGTNADKENFDRGERVR